jgi:hypothetical protein
MFRTQPSAIAWAAGTALILALLVPDFRFDLISVIVIVLLVPVAIAWPIFSMSFQEPKAILVTRGMLIVAGGLLLHSAVSLFIYSLGAHVDNESWGIVAASLLAKAVVALLALAAVWGMHAVKRARYKNAL